VGAEIIYGRLFVTNCPLAGTGAKVRVWPRIPLPR
jgi:hypothetical protein